MSVLGPQTGSAAVPAGLERAKPEGPDRRICGTGDSRGRMMRTSPLAVVPYSLAGVRVRSPA